jgi:mycofactocin precursor
MQKSDKEVTEALELSQETDNSKQASPAHPILEEITIEELAVDGICGIY